MQKEYVPTKSDEELLKYVGYEINSKKKKEEAKPIVGTRKMHTRDIKKFMIKSKVLHNPSLMTEVIDIEGKSEGSKKKKSMKKNKHKTPSEQHLEPSNRRKTQKGSKEKKSIVKELATRGTISILVTDSKTNLDKFVEVAAHMEGKKVF